MSSKSDSEFEDTLEKLRDYKGSVSRLRREITKVSALTDPACRILHQHLQGETVDPALLESAKWTLTTLQNLYDTAIREESVKGKKPSGPRSPKRTRATPTKEGSTEEGVSQPAAKLSTKYTPAETGTPAPTDDTEF